MPNIFQNMSAHIRANHWWKYKAAPILGFTYLYCYLLDISLTEKIIIILLSAVTIVGIAGFGYVINDLYDIEADKKAGKPNRLAGKSGPEIFLIILLLCMVASLPWLYLRSTPTTWLLIGIQILLFILYAHPVTRLKEKSLWGPVCDALYGHAVPIVIACLTYQQYLQKIPYHLLFFFSTLFAWQFLKGIRNIFLHQLEDYDNDIRTQTVTYTTEKGTFYVYRLILKKILPLEVILLLLFFAAVGDVLPLIPVSFFAFLYIFSLGHGLFRNVVINKTSYESNSYLYFLNDWYEDYLPWILLGACISEDLRMAVFALIHIIFFPSSVTNIFADIKSALLETWVQFKNLIYPIYKLLRKHP